MEQDQVNMMYQAIAAVMTDDVPGSLLVLSVGLNVVLILPYAWGAFKGAWNYARNK